ncbi:MAG: single-stranded DNA-binding protein [Caldiserica bacterium]|nr:single-stranded DNA-binding protein [Caldisericota bacterium]
MPNLNKVFVMGNLTRDPELRFTPSGSPVSTLSVAVNRVYTNRAGERKEEVCYVNVQVWGKQAESCTQYLTKGRPVFVEGRLRNRSIEIGEGKTRNIVEVVANRVQFLSRIGGELNTPEAADTHTEETIDNTHELEEGVE